MKILNVVFNKYMGGLSATALGQTELLKKSNYDIIAVTRPRTEIYNNFIKLEVPTLTQDCISNSISFLNPFKILKFKRFVKKNNISIVIIHNSKPTKLFRLSCKNLCPVVNIYHGGCPDRLARNSEYVICVSKHMVETIKNKKDCHNKIYYLPNHVELDLEKEKQVKKFGSKITIGIIARFTIEKGIDNFLKALNDLNFDYEAIIAGDGEMKDDLHSYANKHNLKTKFIGWVDNEQKEDFFNKCDLLVVPSLNETFGIVILEAWKHKIPLISTPTAGAKELIENKQNGIITEGFSPTDIAKSINMIFKNNDLIEKITENGYKKLKKDYSSEAIKDKLEFILKDICSDFFKVKKSL